MFCNFKEVAMFFFLFFTIPQKDPETWPILASNKVQLKYFLSVYIPDVIACNFKEVAFFGFFAIPPKGI